MLVMAILAVPAGAQNAPSSEYPAGRLPGGDASRLGAMRARSRKNNGEEQQRPDLNATGLTVSNDGKHLVIATADHRRLTMAVTQDTRFLKDGAAVPASTVVADVPVQVTAAQDEDYRLSAAQVQIVKDVPGLPPPDPDTSGGAPVKSNDPAMDALIEEARSWTETYTNDLPNFICQQSTTRYYREAGGWQPMDVVGAQVVYEDGKEQYKQITINGRSTDKSMLDLGRGSSSTGEFATVLRGLFAPQTGAHFKFYQNETMDGIDAAIFDYTVGTWTSDWAVSTGSQELWPAYKGSIWVDRNTGEVHRIEMFAQNVPHDFPSDTLEESVDYKPVMLAGRTYFLPVRSENIMCERGSSRCSRNVIEFRDYKKFSGQSDITFDH